MRRNETGGGREAVWSGSDGSMVFFLARKYYKKLSKKYKKMKKSP